MSPWFRALVVTGVAIGCGNSPDENSDPLQEGEDTNAEDTSVDDTNVGDTSLDTEETAVDTEDTAVETGDTAVNCDEAVCEFPGDPDNCTSNGVMCCWAYEECCTVCCP